MEKAVTESIGFIGVGLMGHGIATNLLKAGYPVTVIGHRNRQPVEDLVHRGAAEAASARDLMASSSVLFLCLPDAVAVEAIVQENRDALRPGAVVVDCSTSDPVVSQRLAQDLSVQGVEFCDAPLAGTPDQAAAGTLHAMVGASDDVFLRLQPLFATWAEKVVRVGGVGDGHRMKLINNFLALGYGALYAEALAVARKSGLTVEQVDRVIRGGRMDCGFYRSFMGYALEGDRDAHRFTLTNAFKDMRYVEAMGNSAGCSTYLASTIKNSYAMAVASGGDGADSYVPHLPDFVAHANGVFDG
ncbi:3-hydroxyisobutyrate dehydrogenase [plant metagenome]|uniref:3-hydroxyisobutyrate dehydrogenase n=1 Tax=plant metagenome TaxID=1297885 RepID=A0A484Q6S3_9ZZZZ